MKKIYLGILVIVLICFAIPIIFNVKFFNNIEPTPNEEHENTPPFNYGEVNEIKVLITSTGEIKQMHLDEYLKGVVASEMPASYEQEALKAQAVVARSYTLNKIENNLGKNISEHNGADICDNVNHCQAWITKEDRLARWEEKDRQAYWDKICLAVDSTKGEIITYDGKVINAFFHSNSGGKTESPVEVWGGSIPYLQTVETSGEDAYTQYSSKLEISKENFISKMKEKYSQFEIDFSNINEAIKVEKYTEGGRVKSVKIGNVSLSGVDVRKIFNLKSANFDVKIEENKIIFDVRGYGHGVGMSQTGANTLAKEGKSYQDIINHFYKDIKIDKFIK